MVVDVCPLHQSLSSCGTITSLQWISCGGWDLLVLFLYLIFLTALGPICFFRFLSWYRSQMPESAVIHHYTLEQFDLFSQCYYQALASPAFGERSLSKFMAMSGHMHLSLISLIEKYTLLTSPTRVPSPSSFSYGTFQENLSEKVKKLEMVTLIWGEMDKLRSAEQNSSPNECYSTPSTQTKGKLRKSSMGDCGQLQESEFMNYLQVSGINCEGYEVQMVSFFDLPEVNSQ